MALKHLSIAMALAIGVVCSDLQVARAGVSAYLFGGGHRPVEAMRELIQDAGGVGKARFLVIAWASEDPDDTSSLVRAELKAAGAGDLRASMRPPTTLEAISQLITDLDWATGIYMTGGDQVRLLNGIDGVPQLRERLLGAYQKGVPLAGTSAGTAVLSAHVFTGEEDLGVIAPERLRLRDGLEIIDRVIVDQHFLLRSRMNRLISAILRFRGHLGVGIDENTALIVKETPAKPLPVLFGRVVGPTAVAFLDERQVGPAKGLVSFFLRQGECWNFTDRAPAVCP